MGNLRDEQVGTQVLMSFQALGRKRTKSPMASES